MADTVSARNLGREVQMLVGEACEVPGLPRSPVLEALLKTVRLKLKPVVAAAPEAREEGPEVPEPIE